MSLRAFPRVGEPPELATNLLTDPGIDLRAVAASGTSDVWAAGVAGFRLVMLHFDGRAWTGAPLPVAASTSGRPALRSMAAPGPSDAWAVGSLEADSLEALPLALHWDGVRWSQVVLPFVRYGPNDVGHGQLNDVIALSAVDVWVVGQTQSASIRNVIIPAHPLVLHWDGHRWSVVPAPPLPGALRSGGFQAVAGTGSNDLWAVGSRSGRVPGAFITLVEHWDGRRWMIVPSPNGRYGGEFRDVVVRSPGDAWFVGADGEGSTMTAHWDGERITRIESPDVPGVENFLESVVASSSGDVWALGYHGYVGAREDALIIRLRH